MKISHKEKILKAEREKQQITHKGDPHKDKRWSFNRNSSGRPRNEWQDILKVMREKNLQPRLLYPARISFKYEGEIKSFTNKQKLREFSTTKPALQHILKDLLQTGNTKKVYICCLQETHLKTRDTYRQSEELEKDISHKGRPKESRSSNTHIR